MKQRRYFVVFSSYLGKSLQLGNRVVTLSPGVFDIEKISREIEKNEKRTELVLLFFKELENYEIMSEKEKEERK